MARSTHGNKLDICKLSEDGEKIVAAINGKLDLFRKDFDDLKKNVMKQLQQRVLKFWP